MSPALHRIVICALCTVTVMSGASAQAPEGEAPEAQAVDPRAIELVRQSDRELRERLAARLGVIPGLEKTRIEVVGGVVTLRGEASDDGRRQLATTLVEQAEGVIAVDNQLGIDTNIVTRSQPVVEHLIEKSQQLVAALPLLLIAAVMVFAADRLGRWCSRASCSTTRVTRPGSSVSISVSPTRPRSRAPRV